MPRQPYKRTEARKNAVLEALRQGQTRAAAAAAAGISRDLLATMLEEDHAFWEAAAQAEGQAEARYARKIHEAADTNWQAASWWLERRRPHDYSLRQTVIVQTQKAIDELLEYVRWREPELHARLAALLLTRAAEMPQDE